LGHRDAEQDAVEARLPGPGGVLALDDVEGAAIELAGRLAELVDRLGGALRALRGPLTAEGWAIAIAEAAAMLTDASGREAWQHVELGRLLDEIVDEAGGGATPLSLPEVRALLAGRLAGSATRANFRTGHLTICTMLPMRSVPHRVVCLLGLDDDVFPRASARDGDDLMLADPHVGERDPRREDRQLLLDALMAAGERLIVTYTGRDERSNEPRPPAVPIGELLDAVELTVRPAEDGRPVRERVVVRHPLQPFDSRAFAAGALQDDRVWSFDPVALDGARALRGERRPPPPFLAGPLPPADTRLVELDALVAFAGRPVRAFLRRRLGIAVAGEDDEIDDALPVELDGLQRWAVGQRVLDEVLRGVPLDEALAAEQARGSLPPGALARAVVDGVRPIVELLAACAGEARSEGGDPAPVDVRLDLPAGRLLSGTVPGVHGDVVLAVAYSKVDPRHRLAAWVRWLALTAAQPERPFAAVTIGRAREGARNAAVTIVRLPPHPGGPDERGAFALDRLAELLDLHDRGMREPLPLGCRTSAAYARATMAGRDAVKAAARQWESAFRFTGEDQAPEHELALGGRRRFEELLEAPPRDDEHGDGWAADEASRFGRLARRLWAGPLAWEEFDDR
ncbi:MAG TPA: hypothetical protein VG474_09120, partial [Solirubrobacteraceae bacterium]|nr:hypothetical protein [Solirubrobacteraceae bacterium]